MAMREFGWNPLVKNCYKQPIVLVAINRLHPYLECSSPTFNAEIEAASIEVADLDVIDVMVR